MGGSLNSWISSAVVLAFVFIGTKSSSAQSIEEKTQICAGCHGAGLRGADAPGIAGRSPSYLARQLYDFQQGTRHGEMAAAMQPVVAGLSSADIVNLTAYVASLPVK